MPTLYDLASVLRSKNAGPFQITFDIMFDDEATYRRVIAAARDRKLALSAYHIRRWDSECLTLKRLMAEGALGRVLRFESRMERWRPAPKGGWKERGVAEEGGGLLYDTLMEQSTDEPGVSHALIADAYKFPEDYSSATYRLDPGARWHDGQPITVDDVIWSFKVLKENSPMYARYYENVTEAVAINDREVEFRFDQKGNRELPKIMGDLAVLPKHWWEGTDAKGKKRDITRPTLEAPLGSAAYRIASFKTGSEIIWERVPDYWGAKLPVKVGRENYDRRRYTYFLDDNAEWQAFTKGGLEDFRDENVSRRWATGYNFPAVQAGDVIKKAFPSKSRAKFQGFVINTRKPQFQDARVRKALTSAFDFETLNRTSFFNSYVRTKSFFVGSDLASSGIPEGKELEILEPFRDKLPPELFTSEPTCKPPSSCSERPAGPSRAAR